MSHTPPGGAAQRPIAATAAMPRAAPQPAQSPEKLRQAAQDFVAVAFSELLKPMFDGVDDAQADPFGGGQGEAMFRPMLVQQMAAGIARQGGFGLTDQVAQAMLRMQERSQ